MGAHFVQSRKTGPEDGGSWLSGWACDTHLKDWWTTPEHQLNPFKNWVCACARTPNLQSMPPHSLIHLLQSSQSSQANEQIIISLIVCFLIIHKSSRRRRQPQMMGLAPMNLTHILRVNVETCDPIICYVNTCFYRDEILELQHLLCFPDIIWLSNRSVENGSTRQFEKQGKKGPIELNETCGQHVAHLVLDFLTSGVDGTDMLLRGLSLFGFVCSGCLKISTTRANELIIF